jgi:hypothetical protein
MNTSIGVDSKGVMDPGCWQESNWGGPEDFEGVRRTAWRAHGSQGTLLRQVYGGQAEESCRLNETIIAYWYRMSMITCKWFGC